MFYFKTDVFLVQETTEQRSETGILYRYGYSQCMRSKIKHIIRTCKCTPILYVAGVQLIFNIKTS